jgi:capsular exopolysaccharide synthesis family protein
VSVIPSGPTPPNPAELLGSPRMNALLEELKAAYDYVLIDSAPILLVADGSILAAQANGVVIVVDGTRTRMSSLHGTLNTLRNTHVDILGVVINKLKRSRFGNGYGYGYHQYYANYGYYGTIETNGHSATGFRKIYQMPVYWAKNLVNRDSAHKGA